MKKIMMLLIVAVFMLGVSGQAMAAFQDGDLVRVVFSSAGTNEIATDLGSVTGLTVQGSNYSNFTANNFNLAALGGSATLDNTYVAYYSVTLNPNHGWISGDTSLNTMTGTGSNWSAFSGAAHTVQGAYQVADPNATQITYLMSNPGSFWTAMTNSGGGIGNMKGYVAASSGLATTTLATLASANYLDQKLFYFASASGIGTKTGVSVATLRTYADGHTELNPQNAPATPIPAAAYLFGTGLLGLVGLRRKMAA